MIILPEQEEILDFVCGDKEFWVVSGAQNLAYVKPAKAGATTNLNLVTASGHVYSFLLTEGSAEPDLKLFVDAGRRHEAAERPRHRSSMRPRRSRSSAGRRGRAAGGRRRAQAAGCRQRGRRQDRRRTRQRTSGDVSRRTLQFPYRFKAHQKPFFVSAIYTDGRSPTSARTPRNCRRSTSWSTTAESVAPNLVNFQVEHGVYIVPKVLERGYLAIGKQKLVVRARSLREGHHGRPTPTTDDRRRPPAAPRPIHDRRSRRAACCRGSCRCG